jgi:hypothetical protein
MKWAKWLPEVQLSAVLETGTSDLESSKQGAGTSGRHKVTFARQVNYMKYKWL